MLSKDDEKLIDEAVAGLDPLTQEEIDDNSLAIESANAINRSVDKE